MFSIAAKEQITELAARVFACLMMTVLLSVIPSAALARSTDQQVNEAYELATSGCVAVNNEIPFFKKPADAVWRRETSGPVDETRRYGRSEVRTLSEQGKVLIEHLTVVSDSVPDELTEVFRLSIFSSSSDVTVSERAARKGNTSMQTDLLK
jgi:hypothetical protein